MSEKFHARAHAHTHTHTHKLGFRGEIKVWYLLNSLSHVVLIYEVLLSLTGLILLNLLNPSDRYLHNKLEVFESEQPEFGL